MKQRQRLRAPDVGRLRGEIFEILGRDRAAAAFQRARSALLRLVDGLFVAAAERRQQIGDAVGVDARDRRHQRLDRTRRHIAPFPPADTISPRNHVGAGIVHVRHRNVAVDAVARQDFAGRAIEHVVIVARTRAEEVVDLLPGLVADIALLDFEQKRVFEHRLAGQPEPLIAAAIAAADDLVEDGFRLLHGDGIGADRQELGRTLVLAFFHPRAHPVAIGGLRRQKLGLLRDSLGRQFEHQMAGPRESKRLVLEHVERSPAGSVPQLPAQPGRRKRGRGADGALQIERAQRVLRHRHREIEFFFRQIGAGIIEPERKLGAILDGRAERLERLHRPHRRGRPRRSSRRRGRACCRDARARPSARGPSRR